MAINIQEVPANMGEWLFVVFPFILSRNLEVFFLARMTVKWTRLNLSWKIRIDEYEIDFFRHDLYYDFAKAWIEWVTRAGDHFCKRVTYFVISRATVSLFFSSRGRITLIRLEIFEFFARPRMYAIIFPPRSGFKNLPLQPSRRASLNLRTSVTFFLIITYWRCDRTVMGKNASNDCNFRLFATRRKI